MSNQELIQALREHAEWQRGNEWETPITLGDDLVAAADRLANDQSHIAALQKEIEKLRTGRRWIPVTERLPEKWIDADTRELVNYLVYGPDIGVDIGSYLGKANRWICLGLPVDVTHWMPLQEPPEVE